MINDLDTTKILTGVNYKNARGEISSYTLGGGSKLYQHIISVASESTKFYIISTDSEAYNEAQLANYLINTYGTNYEYSLGGNNIEVISNSITNINFIRASSASSVHVNRILYNFSIDSDNTIKIEKETRYSKFGSDKVIPL